MAVMINDPATYFRQLVAPRSDTFHRLEKEAGNERIPIVGPLIGQLLNMLACLRNAQLILELGTATGYSTLFMAKACRRTGGRIITYEINAALARRAIENVAREGLSDIVDVRCENALEAIRTISGPVDMIFIDIEKKDYVDALPSCARLLQSGGLLVADNTGFKDADMFNKAVSESPEWESVNLWSYLPGHSPEQDGFCLAMKM
jgi:caffeoyl-CoA O-methyltransferase